MLYWVRGEKLLAVVHFIYFLRILQKLSNILHPSRQNWTTEVCFFLQKEDNSWKYLSQLLLTSYFILVCLNENYWRLLILFLHGLIGTFWQTYYKFANSLTDSHLPVSKKRLKTKSLTKSETILDFNYVKPCLDLLQL